MKHELPYTELPSGTVTFLFTDIEGSTKLLKQLGDGYAVVLSQQRELLRECFKKWNGQEVDTQGDAFFYSFTRATDAIKAAVDAQRSLASHVWPESLEVRLRMGLHTGEPLSWDEGYVGIDVHRAARIAHVGHGGQVLLSATTAPLVRGELPEGVALLDLGRHRLKDIKYPERIAQLVIDGLPSEFPPLTSLEALPVEDPLSLKSARLPSFLEKAEAESQPPVFVARERELEILEKFLQNALRGNGGIAFVTGGPGRGKTALLEEFGRQAIDRYPDLLFMGGECSAYRGIGDPYLPFRRVMAMLTGNVEAEWVSGAINREDALRLWNTMPSITRVIVEYGPDLLDVFVPGRDLMARVNTAVDAPSSWREQLGKLVERDRSETPDIEQRNLFEQYVRVLKSVAVEHPLVIILDDMQWADGASLNLLFHLGRRLEGERILIVGAYRPEEIALDRGDGPHPLEKILAEFKRQFGDIEVDLGKTGADESRHFIDAYIDSERNRLSPDFRAALFSHTEGHPLFTVELLRNLQERDDIVQDSNGAWVETSELDWSILPARVEGVIEERIGRLEDELKETLTVASVEGVDFTAQIVARVREVKERALVHQLSQELDKVHRLVQEHGILEIQKQRLYQYRFRHQLFQQHLYSGLGDFERTELHREVGSILEDVYGDRAGDIAPQLAYHFTEAGESERALEYLIKAGDQARMIYAHAEAVEYYRSALKIIGNEGDPELKAHTLMKLGLVYTSDYQSEKATETFVRAFELWEPLRAEWDIANIRPHANELYIAVSEPIHWDPGIITDDVSGFIIWQLFEGLVEVRPDLNVLPAAASRWDVSNDGKVYTVLLREGLKWSDGTPLTAHDYERGWKRNISLAPHSANANLLDVIENAQSFMDGEINDIDKLGVRAVDNVILEIRLENPTAYFPYLLAHHVAFPLHQSNLETSGEMGLTPELIIGNGPYRIADWEPGKQLILESNPYYQGIFHGNVGRIVCSIIKDFSVVLKAYEVNDLHAVSLISADSSTVERALALYPDDLYFAPQPSTFHLTFLVDRPPFQDVHVRRAFSKSIDRDALFQEVLGWQYRPALGGFLPPGTPGHSPNIGPTFDPVEARRELAEAGFPDGEGFPKVTLLYSGAALGDPIVRFLIKSWKDELELAVNAKSVSWSNYLERRDHNPAHLSIGGWLADYPDPDSMLRITFHSAEGINAPRWKNRRFDGLVENAAKVMDQEKRIAMYQEADRILVFEETVVIPLGYAQGRHLMKSWVRMPKVAPYLMRFKDIVLEETSK